MKENHLKNELENTDVKNFGYNQYNYKKLPVARTNNVVMQECSDEILIYDLKTHKTFSLNKTASIVYMACDGITTFAALKDRNGLSDEMICFTLDELKNENLLIETDSYISPFSGISRRQVVKQVGLASAIALPIISSLIAPEAANAQSGCATCTTLGTQCGLISDGCGNTLNCGNCSEFGPHWACLSNTCNCVTTTCGLESANCGTISDGCGGVLFCGSCGPTQTCINNFCTS